MREIHFRDLHTELGEQIDVADDMESLLEIRLEMATLREAHAKEVADHIEGNYKQAVKDLVAATSKRTYWEDQLQKIRGRKSPTTTTEGPTTATESRTFVVHTNGVSVEEIDRLIQEKASEAFKYLEAEGRAVFE